MTRKVGRITVAVCLVAFGMALLLDNLNLYVGAISLVTRFWPAILIGFGIEYLVYTVVLQGAEERRLRLDWGGAFLLAFIVLLSVGITGFRSWAPHFGGGINLGIGPAETRTETTAVPVAGAREIQVDVPVGSVVLQEAVGTDEIKVDAEYTANGFDLAQVRSQLDQIRLKTESGDVVRIAADVPINLRNVNIRFVVSVPANLKVRANAGAGRIEVKGYKGDMTLTSNVGRIEVDSAAGSLNANSGSGYIGVRGFDGPVTAKTNVGGVEVSDINGALQLDSGTGSVVVREYRGGALVAETRTGRIDVNTRTALEGDVRLKTSTGAIVLDVPEESSVQATAQTRTGSLQAPSYMNVTRTGTSSSAVGSANGGKYTVSLEAGTGSVHFIAH